MVRMYFPDVQDKKRPPNREFIYTVLASLKPEFAKRLLESANSKRHDDVLDSDGDPKFDPEIMELLCAHSFHSVSIHFEIKFKSSTNSIT